VNTDELISRLVADARPVRRVLDPTRRASLWVAASLVCVVLGVLHFGPRDDAADAWYATAVVLRIALLAATMWLAVVTAFRLSVPGFEGRVFSRWWPIIPLGILVAMSSGELVAAAMTGSAGAPLFAWSCVRKVATVGTIPAALSILLIRRAAPLEPRWAALLGVLAAGAAGALTSELACPIRAPVHILLWHVMPVVASAAIGAVAGILLWARRHSQG
jgi:hypothetical protein